MTPVELARVLRTGLDNSGNPELRGALAAMIAECGAVEQEQRHGVAYDPPPQGSPLPPYAEHQATPNGQFHRVMVWFAGDVEQAKHFALWFNRGDWAKYESWYRSLATVAAPESKPPQREPAEPTNEPQWPVLPPPSDSAPLEGTASSGGPVIRRDSAPPSTTPFDAAITTPLHVGPMKISPANLTGLTGMPVPGDKVGRAGVYHDFKSGEASETDPNAVMFCVECDGTEWADQHQSAGDIRVRATKRVNGG